MGGDDDQARYSRLRFKTAWRSTREFVGQHRRVIVITACCVGLLLIGTSAWLVIEVITDEPQSYSEAGFAIGGTLGTTTAYFVGSIGVAAMGTAVGIPALVLGGGAAVLLGCFGYTVGDLLGPELDAEQREKFELACSIAFVGVLLFTICSICYFKTKTTRMAIVFVLLMAAGGALLSTKIAEIHEATFVFYRWAIIMPDWWNPSVPLWVPCVGFVAGLAIGIIVIRLIRSNRPAS